jgi:multidrug efflux pump subunit AcrA (membrane-fusion protein)
MAAQILEQYETAGLKLKLCNYPALIRAAKSKVAEARKSVDEARADRDVAEAELLLEVSATLDEKGKPRYPNVEARNAELTRRKACDEDYQAAERAWKEAEWALAEAQGALDQLVDEFKAVRYVTRLVTAEITLLAEDDQDNDDEEAF